MMIMDVDDGDDDSGAVDDDDGVDKNGVVDMMSLMVMMLLLTVMAIWSYLGPCATCWSLKLFVFLLVLVTKLIFATTHLGNTLVAQQQKLIRVLQTSGTWPKLLLTIGSGREVWNGCVWWGGGGCGGRWGGV